MDLGAIVQAVDFFLKYMYTGNTQVGEVGKAPGTWIDGSGWHYGSSSTKFYMGFRVVTGRTGEGEMEFYDESGFQIFTTPGVADMGSFTVIYNAGWCYLNSGSNFDFQVHSPSSASNYDIDKLVFGLNLDSAQSNWWYNSTSSALPSQGGGNFIGMHANSSGGSGILSNVDPGNASYGGVVYVPIQPGMQYTYDDAMLIILPVLQTAYPDLNITADMFISESAIIAGNQDATEETSGNGCNCDCTTIYVNADGSLILQNEVSGNYALTIDNNADLSLNVNAAAGAFGAGSIVIDPDANINLSAGAFAAGAFGAGAIASPDIDISGEVSVSEVSISGGDINIDQSGSTITNNYYYQQDPTEPETQPFSIDYNEILSEGELESILTQETYEIIDIETVSEMYLPETIPGDVSVLPGEVVVVSNNIIDTGSQIITDSGLMPVYAPLALFSVACYVLRGLR